MRTKNITSILTRAAMLLVLMLTTATSWAQEHSGTTTDGLTWSLSQDASGNYTVLTISGTGLMNDYGHTTVNGLWRTDAPWGWQTLTSVIIKDGVTSIGRYAFIGCQNLESVTIGSGVTSIRDGAINHCDKLTTITLPENVVAVEQGALENCQALHTIYIQHDGPVSLTGYKYVRSENSFDMQDMGNGVWRLHMPQYNVTIVPQWVENGPATGLGEAPHMNDGEMTNDKDKWFTIDGRKLKGGMHDGKNLLKGIYIVNGKKVVVK